MLLKFLLLIRVVRGKQFDVDNAILNALAGLEVQLAVQSSVKLDDCKLRRAFGVFHEV